MTLENLLPDQQTTMGIFNLLRCSQIIPISIQCRRNKAAVFHLTTKPINLLMTIASSLYRFLQLEYGNQITLKPFNPATTGAIVNINHLPFIMRGRSYKNQPRNEPSVAPLVLNLNKKDFFYKCFRYIDLLCSRLCCIHL